MAKRTLRRLLFIGIHLLICSSTFAQEVAVENYVVTQFGLAEGLPQSTINDIIQTSDGYIWLATFGGLVRFDGHQFITFNRSNTEGLEYDRVVSIFEDSNKNIWGASEQGVVRLSKGKATSYTIENRTTSISAGWISEDKDGRIWGALNESFYLLKNNRFERQTLWQADETILEQMSNDTSGVHLFLGKTIVKSYKDRLYKIVDLSNDVNSHIVKMVEDPKKPGSIFIGTSNNGILKLEGNKINLPEQNSRLSVNDLIGVYVDREDRLWAYSTKEAFIKDGSHFKPFRIPGKSEGLGFQIRFIFEDNEGNLWFGSVAKGVFRFKKTKISMIDENNGLTNQRMLSLTKLNDGSLIFGTNCGGYFVSKNGVIDYPASNDFLPNNCVWSVFQDSKDRVWFSSEGLYMSNSLHEEGKRFDLSDGFEGDNIFALYEDRQGNIWIGCSNGIFKYNDESGFSSYKKADGSDVPETRVIFEDTRGAIWAGTVTGVYKIADSTAINVSLASADGYLNESDEPYIRAIYEDNEGIFWFGSYGNGIFRMEGDKLLNIGSKDGLFDNVVSHIVVDKNDNFWIGSNRGIFRVSRNELNDFAKGQIKEVSSYSYGTGDGMNSAETNGGFQPSAIKDSVGNIYFPTVSGVAVVTTEQVSDKNATSTIYIEKITGSEFELSSPEKVELSYNDTFLEIKYTAINFTDPDKVKFRYRLAGLHENWIDVGSARSALYTKIPPGDYTFQVVAANSSGVWNDEGASFRITVVPPFWQTGWFYFFSIITGVMVIVSLYYRKVQQLKSENERQKRFSEQLIESEEQERRRIANELHDSLGQQILVIKNRAELAKNYLDNPMALQEQLNDIVDSAQSSISDVRTISHGLRPVHLERFGLTEAIMNLCDNVRQTSDIEWIVEIDDIDNTIESEKEINFYRVIQEAINNILKHSSATKAEIFVKIENSEISTTIIDNGSGFNPDKREHKEGLGLTGMIERVESLGGVFKINTNHIGTSLSFRVPINSWVEK